MSRCRAFLLPDGKRPSVNDALLRQVGGLHAEVIPAAQAASGIASRAGRRPTCSTGEPNLSKAERYVVRLLAERGEDAPTTLRRREPQVLQMGRKRPERLDSGPARTRQAVFSGHGEGPGGAAHQLHPPGHWRPAAQRARPRCRAIHTETGEEKVSVNGDQLLICEIAHLLAQRQLAI
jgi:hypothetical protein